MKAVWNRPGSFSNMLWRQLKNTSLQQFLEMHSLKIHSINTYTHPMLASSHIANQNNLWSSTDTHTCTLSACPSSTPAVFPLGAYIQSFQAWECGTCWIWIHTIPLRLTLLLVYSPTQPRKHKHLYTSCRLSECVRDTATLLAFGFVLACFSALYTVCMMVTLQSCSMKVSRAKNVTPLKHGTAGLCWNLSLARSLDVFTAAEQRQQNTMLTSHSGRARVNCDRLRSSLDCSIESGKKKTVWMQQFLCESSPVYKV